MVKVRMNDPSNRVRSTSPRDQSRGYTHRSPLKRTRLDGAFGEWMKRIPPIRFLLLSERLSIPANSIEIFLPPLE